MKKKNRKSDWKKKQKAKIQARKKHDDNLAKQCNRPNGGCFHSQHSIRVKENEEKKLRQSIKDHTGQCITKHVTPEEAEAMITDIAARKYE